MTSNISWPNREGGLRVAPISIPTYMLRLEHGQGPYLCAKCNKVSDYALKVKREGKGGRIYNYFRFRHKDRRKHSGVKYCYLRIPRD